MMMIVIEVTLAIIAALILSGLFALNKLLESVRILIGVCDYNRIVDSQNQAAGAVVNEAFSTAMKREVAGNKPHNMRRPRLRVEDSKDGQTRRVTVLDDKTEWKREQERKKSSSD